MRSAAVIACVVAVTTLSRATLADDAKSAAEHFREGQRAYEAHDYKHAAEEFEAANKAKPAAAALLGAALSWEHGGDAVRAANDFAAALDAGGLEARDAATARAHLADLDAKVGHLEIRGEAAARVTVDGDYLGPLPLDVRVIPGDHAVELTAATGATIRRVVTVGPGLTLRVDMSQPKAAPETPPPEPSSGSTQRILGWTGVGVGGGAVVAGVIVGVVGISTRNEFVDGGAVDAALHDQAVAMRTWANVLLISGAVLGIVGGVLLFTAPRASAVGVGVGPASATLRVTF